MSTEDAAVEDAITRREELLADRLNAKAVEVVDAWDELEERANPRMDRIGPAVGAHAEHVMREIAGTLIDELPAEFTIDGEVIELEDDWYEVEQVTPPETAGTAFEGGTAYIDATLTPDLAAEGYAREVVRRIQQMRKDLDLEIDAEIRTMISIEDPEVTSYVDAWRDYIATETRTAEFVDDGLDGTAETWDVEDVTVEIAIATTGSGE